MTPLMIACDGNHLEGYHRLVCSLIAAKADVNRRTVEAGAGGEERPNALHAQRMRAMHWTTRRQPADGMTPLMLAARDGHVVAVEALVKHGARVEAANESGDIAWLLWARTPRTLLCSLQARLRL